MEDKNYTVIDKKKIDSLDLTIPDTCPFCHHGIHPEILFGYDFHKNDYWNIRVVYACPRKACLEMFFGIYSKNTLFNIYDSSLPKYVGCSPFKFKEEEFSEPINEISENFVSIFNQAKQAEERKLDQICGLGYRKALEFLVKDYLIIRFPEEAEKIKNNHRFDAVIEQYVTDEKVKFLARRASWLGNDHAHYTQKWEDKDISDLKRLIKTALYWISAEKELEYYESEMKEGRR
ncbi:DUF4145 domain-containing protein [Paenibacillus roseipurpureus]|uniref:DUF4145 domain-containing protein n=1 Tax=Paenibacillus roseopurpureus TaxID=2918901 RepID=A0AA96LMD6_9BACL|nr:hypothetical protein [Paenibacillus sp. MBLB1832]WNR43673.1 hypothetical protein MJB10_21610 [Paenibacillus sp. MBLB1832]